MEVYFSTAAVKIKSETFLCDHCYITKGKMNCTNCKKTIPNGMGIRHLNVLKGSYEYYCSTSCISGHASQILKDATETRKRTLEACFDKNHQYIWS